MPINLPPQYINRKQTIEVCATGVAPRLLMCKSAPNETQAPVVERARESRWKPQLVTVVTGSEMGVLPIKYMRLPSGWWQYLPTLDVPPGIYNYEFSPKADRKVSIVIRTEGREDFAQRKTMFAKLL